MQILNVISFEWVDITISLSVLVSLSQELLETVVRYAIFFKTKFGNNFVTSLSRQKCQNFKNLKQKILENDEFYIVARFRLNA